MTVREIHVRAWRRFAALPPSSRPPCFADTLTADEAYQLAVRGVNPYTLGNPNRPHEYTKVDFETCLDRLLSLETRVEILASLVKDLTEKFLDERRSEIPPEEIEGGQDAAGPAAAAEDGGGRL